MTRRTRIRPRGRFAALALLAALAATAARSDEISVDVDGVRLGSVVLRGLDGDELGPGSATLLPPAGSLGDADFAITGDQSIELVVPAGVAFRVDLEGRAQGLRLVVRERRGGVVVRLLRFDGVVVPDGRAVVVDVDAAGGVAMRSDADGDGSPESPVAPTQTLTGAAAADRTPPTIEYERRADGTHALRLLDAGADITSAERLFVSIDGGSRYQPYVGPLSLDPRTTPAILAIGRDDADNQSGVQRFATAADACARVADERVALRALIDGVVATAVGDGLVPAAPAPAALLPGAAACLFRRAEDGADVSCSACAGVHAAGYDGVELVLLVPDATSASARETLAERLRVVAGADPRVAELRARLASRAAFEGTSATAPRADDRPLAERLRAYTWALTGEYVDGHTGTPLDTVVQRVRAAGLPRADGHEAARLAEQVLLATGLLLRLPGQAFGAVASVPELDSFENRLLREQLRGAADAAALATIGLLGSDACAAAAAVPLVSRSAYAASACAGSGCRSLAGFAAARLAVGRTVCASLAEENLDAELAEHAAVREGSEASLAALFGDECVANAHLGRALLRVRALGERTSGDWQEQLAAADPGERARRDGARTALDAARAEQLSRYAVDWKLRVTNGATEPIAGVVLRMSEDGAPTGQQRVLDVPPRTALVITGDAVAGQPFFVQRDVVASPANELHRILFTLEPGNARAEQSEGTRLAALDYYVFDPQAPICPVPRPLPPPDAQAAMP